MFINSILAHIDLGVYKVSYIKRLEDTVEAEDSRKMCIKTARASANKTWRRSVRKYHGAVCWNCKEKRPQKLQIHHIVPVAEDPTVALDIKNCVILCEKCHKQYHQDNALDKRLLNILA